MKRLGFLNSFLFAISIFIVSVGLYRIWYHKKPRLSYSLHYLAKCAVLDSGGSVLFSLPQAYYCWPFKNGDIAVIGGSPLGLRYYNRKFELLWERPGFFHHAFYADDEETKIFAIGSEFRPWGGKSVRFDIYYVFGRDGSIKHKISTYDLRYTILSALIKNQIGPVAPGPLFSLENWTLAAAGTTGKEYLTSNFEFVHANFLAPYQRKEKCGFLSQRGIVLGTASHLFFYDLAENKIKWDISIEEILRGQASSFENHPRPTAHTPSFISDCEIMLYVNFFKHRGITQSTVIGYGLGSRKFRIIYKSVDKKNRPIVTPTQSAATKAMDGFVILNKLGSSDFNLLTKIDSSGRTLWSIETDGAITGSAQIFERDFSAFLENRAF